MIHVARWTLIVFGICVGIPYVLVMIGLGRIADRRAQKRLALLKGDGDSGQERIDRHRW